MTKGIHAIHGRSFFMINAPPFGFRTVSFGRYWTTATPVSASWLFWIDLRRTYSAPVARCHAHFAAALVLADGAHALTLAKGVTLGTLTKRDLRLGHRRQALKRECTIECDKPEEENRPTEPPKRFSHGTTSMFSGTPFAPIRVLQPAEGIRRPPHEFGVEGSRVPPRNEARAHSLDHPTRGTTLGMTGA
jgi:hypothetical protein